MNISYAEARADHEYLWSIEPAADMTGAYVDQDDLAKLLKNPTKATARDCYCRQIAHWFSAGTESGGRDHSESLIHSDEKVKDIAIRHWMWP